MKHFFSIFLLIALSFSCMELDEANQDLCIPVVCGEIQNDNPNLALFNGSGIDFDSLFYDIGGQRDSVGFFPLNQYTCWINLDTLKTDYIFAKGISDNDVFPSDTLWMQQNTEAFTSGVFVLEIYKLGDNNKLEFQFVEDYDGECKDL